MNVDERLIEAIESVAKPNWAVVLQAIGAVGGLIAATIGFIVVYLQVRQIRDALHSEAHGTLYTQANDLLKTLLKHADLYPYFFEGKDIAKGDSQYNRVQLLAQTWTAHFEHVLMQRNYLPSHIRSNWEHYIRSVYSTSPILRQYLIENEKSYSDQLHETVKGVQPVQEDPVSANQALQQEVGRRQ